MNAQLDPTATFYTVKEVAVAWRLSRMTVYRMVESGAITSVRVGRSIRLNGESVRAFPRNVRDSDG